MFSNFKRKSYNKKFIELYINGGFEQLNIDEKTARKVVSEVTGLSEEKLQKLRNDRSEDIPDTLNEETPYKEDLLRFVRLYRNGVFEQFNIDKKTARKIISQVTGCPENILQRLRDIRDENLKETISSNSPVQMTTRAVSR